MSLYLLRISLPKKDNHMSLYLLCISLLTRKNGKHSSYYLIESCLDLNLNLGFWLGDSQSEYFYAQETLHYEL